jgi:hypothetical protein
MSSQILSRRDLDFLLFSSLRKAVFFKNLLDALEIHNFQFFFFLELLRLGVSPHRQQK